jgi:Uma2 family endonuclease
VSFVAKGRIPGEELTNDFSDVPPDLAIEVVSPEDRVRDVYDRIGEYLQVGVPLVWVVDPEQRAAAVYRSVTDVRRVGSEDFLDGEAVVPGFRCRLAEVID